MRKTNFWVMTVVVATLFVMTLVYLSVAGSGLNRDAAPAATTEVSSEADARLASAAATTATPTPAPTAIPVFIPGVDELPMSVRLEELSLPAEEMTVTGSGTGCIVEWPPVDGADYYVLYTSPDGSEYGISQIVNGSDTRWEFLENNPLGYMVLAYRDNEVKGTEDDELLAVFLNKSLIPTPTATPEPTKGPTPTRKPTATPKPTNPPTPTPAPLPYKIIVDKADCAFAVFSLDDSGNYTVKVATFPAALGGTRTPDGTHKIGSKQSWKAWNGGTYSPFATRYASGIYFHGPVYRSMDPGDMIPSYYEAIGTNASQGCVRTTVAGARFVYYNCAAGTVVEVENSSDLVSYPGKPAIDPAYPTWDPTDPSPRPTPTGEPTATPTPTPTPVPPTTVPTETTVAATTTG